MATHASAVKAETVTPAIPTLPFTARVLPFDMGDGTVHPPREVSEGFVTLAEFEAWIDKVMMHGGGLDYYRVNRWLKTAKPGDAVLLNDDLRPVSREFADFEIRRNY